MVCCTAYAAMWTLCHTNPPPLPPLQAATPTLKVANINEETLEGPVFTTAAAPAASQAYTVLQNPRFATASSAATAAASPAAAPAAPHAAPPAASLQKVPSAASPSSAHGHLTPGPAKQPRAQENKKTSVPWGSRVTANRDRVLQPRVQERSTPGIPRQVKIMNTCLVSCVTRSVHRLLPAVNTIHSLHLSWMTHPYQ